MRVKNLLGRKTAAILLVGAVGLGLAGCLPNTSATPPSDGFTNQLYNSLNQDRASAGLPPLTWSPKLANNASNWAVQMMSANSLYHQNLSGLMGTSDYQGFYTLGENIIVGPGDMSPASLESSWRGSPLHWANITNRSFNVVGIGYARGSDGRIWAVQEFGGV
jgi:uncharacterized protein YkwD